MDMKDRVDNFLKVAKERVSENIENIGKFNDLCGSLASVIKDKELQDYLFVEYMKITDEVEIQEWDERFLNIIAGEDIRSPEEKLYDLNRKISQGVGRQRMGQTLAVPHGTGVTNATLSGAGMSTNAVWANNNATLEKELQELKDEIRANRYKTP